MNPSRSKLFIAIMLMAATLTLSGCFKDQPSDNEIIAQSTAYFNQQLPSLLVAKKVLKKNGYKQDATHYIAQMDIQATAKQSLSDYIDSIVGDPSLSPFEKMAASMRAGMLKLTLPDLKAGEAVDFKKQYLFIKTDNGWMLNKEFKPQN